MVTLASFGINIDIAASIGCGLSTLGHYEAGRRKPTQNVLTTLCNKFPKYTIWLITGKTNFPEQIDAITESKQGELT